MENLELFPSFKRSDGVSGSIKGYKKAEKLGSAVRIPIGDYKLDKIGNNEVYQIRFDLPKYEKHITKLLEGL